PAAPTVAHVAARGGMDVNENLVCCRAWFVDLGETKGFDAFKGVAKNGAHLNLRDAFRTRRTPRRTDAAAASERGGDIARRSRRTRQRDPAPPAARRRGCRRYSSPQTA